MTLWESLADRVLTGEAADREAALAVLASPDEEILAVLAAAYRIRRHYFGRRVRFHYLLNAKSGRCGEDCAYCSQSARYETGIPTYPLVDREAVLAGAERALNLGAATYCIVMSGRRPRDAEIDQLAEAVQAVKARYPLRICTSLGLVTEAQALRLKAAGVDRYNHNLNTSARFTPSIVTTHTYADRVATVQRIQQAGLSACTGFIAGLGEEDGDLVDVALALRALEVDSVPVNFLIPIPGTPLGHRPRTSALRALRIAAMLRFVLPDKEIRLAGGREGALASLQPMGLYAANSLFVADYLTTPGQDPGLDHRMVQDLGFEVEEPEGEPAAAGPG
ncbi:biotin synthase [Candidatus Hydrogenisulfobacillus filiaventi]|uniref:Biotin synthase n=1 Tax=Candidatus Hydrogenisulfobacillus filiaventi TaxID=2707344 RepID=A0A6F8ZCG6_9FIRM|nr:biotin synthase BioB [Bacillota bacterium]CAB1127621.1 biotin synthase [Candidatus Hydrogenisulfobacillus filiaventi]